MFRVAIDSDRPMVIDADGLNLLAQSPRKSARWILTPHPGEAGRLLGLTTAQIQRDRLSSAQEIARRYGGAVVLKGAGTLVVTEGALPALCDRGNPGMATPGMGDVLTGVVTGLLAQTADPVASASAGVLVHALAGGLAARRGERGLLASDLFEYLPTCVNPVQRSISDMLNLISGRPLVRRIVYIFAIIFLIIIIILPPILGISFKLDLITQVLGDEMLLNRAKSAVLWSFLIAFIIAFIDLIAGLPMAWMIARGKSKWINVIDALVDVPFVIPTVALGFSTLIFWSSELSPFQMTGWTLSPGLVLILLLHFAFSFPVIVRVMVGELLTYKEIYETAAKSLGARSFTVARTVTLPILKSGLIAAFLLAFARSLSETGATIIVAGAFEKGPVFIRNAKDAGLEGPMLFVSFILIVTSIVIFGVIP